MYGPRYDKAGLAKMIVTICGLQANNSYKFEIFSRNKLIKLF
jgi:hypothetical protein